MDPFDELERELRAGLRRVHGAARSARRQWRAPLLGVLAALLVTGGALAATGTIRTGPILDSDHGEIPKHGPHFTSSLKPLALRVADPAGGPPWTLRVFAVPRGTACVQVGQFVLGQFGVFGPPGTFETPHASPGPGPSICSRQVLNHFPVVRGLQRLRAIGGPGTEHRCPGRPDGECPLTSVKLLSYGLLGPGARRVQLVDAGGRTLASMRTSARIGGAYLFAVALPTAAYLAALPAEIAAEDRYIRQVAAARASGRTQAQAIQEATRASEGLGGGATSTRSPDDVGVLATFANGRTLRVAGRRRSHAALPGVGRASKRAP
jgi:hypothetical protein